MTSARTPATRPLVALVLLVALALTRAGVVDGEPLESHGAVFVRSGGWKRVPGGGDTLCRQLVHGNTLPDKDGAYRVCVASGESGSANTRTPALLSLYSTVKHIPEAVFFRLPLTHTGGGGGGGNWPHGGVHADFSWKPSSSRQPFDGTGNGEYLRVQGNRPEKVESRGHLLRRAYYSHSNRQLGLATFTFFNAAPTYQPWDGTLWGRREDAVVEYVSRHNLGPGELYVVAGTYGPPLYQLRLKRAKPNPGEVTLTAPRSELVDVPKGLWTALYDSKNNRALAWRCEQRADLLVKPHDGGHPCRYLSVKDVAQLTGVDPFPDIDNQARSNEEPSVFDPTTDQSIWTLGKKHGGKRYK